MGLGSRTTRREFIQMASSAALALHGGSSPEAWGLGETPSNASGEPAKKVYDLGQLSWQLCGMTPFLWKIDKLADIRQAKDAEVGPLNAQVPGSVQLALLRAGEIKDWNYGLNAREIEWIENRDWIYQAELPDAFLNTGKHLWLRCAGLDYAGAILVNGDPVLNFRDSFLPYAIDLRPFVKPSGNLLQIWFQLAPRWLGEFGYTSEIKEWKTRFGYYWDWTSRMVQTGVWDSLTLETFEAGEIRLAACESDVDLASGSKNLTLQVETNGGARVHATLKDNDRLVHEETITVQGGFANASWHHLPVDLWWPNGMGSQPLYELTIELLNEAGQLLDIKKLRTGFRHVEWVHTEGAAPDAYPYLCKINGKGVFLFGVNWTPIRPNFADLKEPEYSKRIQLYRELGMNILRVWGGACREREWFYDLCDEHGLLVWQEFPLCSSGIDNCPPDDPKSIEEQAAIAKGYIERLRHHTSLILWGGGNELEDNRAGSQSKNPTLTIANHPMVKRLGEVVKQNDPGRAYVPTAPFGPIGTFTMSSVGQSAHWDVHGPYDPDGPVTGEWATLWKHDDAMFHSEVGCPGASSVDIIERYSGNLHPMPATHNNPLWNRQPWWVDWSKFIDEKGHEPSSLAEYVEWSQKRQADALAIALVTAQSRFPACGGIIFWMGHDAFPCTANLSIVDFDGNPKPAATRLRDVLRRRT